MDLQLGGKVVLITGSSRRIGLATAKAFAAEGCRLMLSARSAEPLAEAEAAFHTSAVDVAAHAADVNKPDEAAGLVQAAVAVFGGIDVLINNIGGGGGRARIADRTDYDWRDAMDRNLIQTVRMMRLALPQMKGHQCGIDFRLVAPARNARAVRRGKGGADFRYRALGTGICAARHPGQLGFARLNSRRGQWLGPLPPRQPGIF